MIRRPLIALVCALAAALISALPASADTLVGSRAWSNVPLTLRQGPGAEYRVVGEIPGEIRIIVNRCSRLWCNVSANGQTGWTSLALIDFGRAPGGLFSGPKLNYPRGGPGLVCFHTGENFTGTAICSESGTVVKDLLLYGMDNRFASVSIRGNVSVTVCRDREFKSYCERVIESQPRLDKFLVRTMSSYRVY